MIVVAELKAHLFARLSSKWMRLTIVYSFQQVWIARADRVQQLHALKEEALTRQRVDTEADKEDEHFSHAANIAQEIRKSISDMMMNKHRLAQG